MFKKMMNVAVITILFAASTVFAAPMQRLSNQEKESLKAYQKEMQEFGQKEVHPKLLEIKKTFDQSISKSDLATLNDLRDKASSDRKDNMKQMMKNQRGKNGGRGQMMDSAQMNINKEEMQVYKADLDKIIKNNPKQYEKLKSDLQKLQSDVQPKFESKQKELLEKYPDLKNRPNIGKNHNFGMLYQSPENFLLWDGQMMMGNRNRGK